MTPENPALAKCAQNTVAIWGLGREGLSTYRFLRQLWPTKPLSLFDDAPAEKLSPEWQAILRDDSTLTFSAPPAPPDLPAQLPQVVFKTPGIPLSHPFLQVINSHELAITSNTQLFLELLKTLSGNVITIGVTGTKGKSTTSAVIHHVLKTAGKSTWLAGNIGVPALDLLSELEVALAQQPSQLHFVVLELSCHQLNDMSLSPHIAVIQNIVPEHLDYYGTFEAYVAAKQHIVQFQEPTDYVIYNHEYPVPTQIARSSQASHLAFSLDEAPSFLNNRLLQGQHNLENLMPAMIIGQLFKIDDQTLEAAVKTFKPLPHRLELVGSHGNVEYYNDSLATVPEAALAALQAFKDRSVVLIAGGYDRGLDYSEFGRKLAETKLRGLILFPTTGEKIEAALRVYQPQPQYPILQVTSMAEAVAEAQKLAQAGDVVLLSPAAASFNLFEDYADRGNQFKAAVEAIA